jgi:hypothetical protein
MFSNTLQSVSSIQASFPRHIPKATAVLSKLNLVRAATTTAITPIYLIVIGINTTPRLGLPWRLAWNRASKYTVSAPVLSQFMIEIMFYPVGSADGLSGRGAARRNLPICIQKLKWSPHMSRISGFGPPRPIIRRLTFGKMVTRFEFFILS